jgi:hypothetical protein
LARRDFRCDRVPPTPDHQRGLLPDMAHAEAARAAGGFGSEKLSRYRPRRISAETLPPAIAAGKMKARDASAKAQGRATWLSGRFAPLPAAGATDLPALRYGAGRPAPCRRPHDIARPCAMAGALRHDRGAGMEVPRPKARPAGRRDPLDRRIKPADRALLDRAAQPTRGPGPVSCLRLPAMRVPEAAGHAGA